MAVVEVVEGIVAGIVPGGRGIVRDANGIIFVRGGLPAEHVHIEVEREKRGVRHGVVVRVLQPSPERVVPDCALHPRCGGCDFLDFSTTGALAARVQIVKDALVRIAKLERSVVDAAVAPIRAPVAGDDSRRRRARFVVVAGKATFAAPESHERVPIERCPALHPALDAVLPKVPGAHLGDGIQLKLACDDRGHVSAAIDSSSSSVDDCARIVAAGVAHGAIALRGDHEIARAGDPVLVGEVAPGFDACASDAGVFTQATRFGGRAILDHVVEAASLHDGARVLELFAGAGHLTIPLLRKGAYVHAIEGAARSVAFLRENAATHDRCVILRAFIDGSLALTDDVDVLVADPPRTGIPDFAAILAKVPKVSRIVLVSCDPATGARDIARAMTCGFTLDRLTPIDAFPRTSHVEWVARLSR